MSLAALPWPGLCGCTIKGLQVPAVLCVVSCLESVQTWLINAVANAASPAVGSPHPGTLSWCGDTLLSTSPLLQGHSLYKTGADGGAWFGRVALLGSRR